MERVTVMRDEDDEFPEESFPLADSRRDHPIASYESRLMVAAPFDNVYFPPHTKTLHWTDFGLDPFASSHGGYICKILNEVPQGLSGSERRGRSVNTLRVHGAINFSTLEDLDGEVIFNSKVLGFFVAVFLDRQPKYSGTSYDIANASVRLYHTHVKDGHHFVTSFHPVRVDTGQSRFHVLRTGFVHFTPHSNVNDYVNTAVFDNSIPVSTYNFYRRGRWFTDLGFDVSFPGDGLSVNYSGLFEPHLALGLICYPVMAYHWIGPLTTTPSIYCDVEWNHHFLDVQ